MTNKLKTYFNWSSGKDAALAFYYLQQDGRYNIDMLLTSINSQHDRVSMHGLRRELLNNQIKSLGLPVTTVELPEEPSMDDYNRIMKSTIGKLTKDGYNDCGFGDIFLEDLRAYREAQLEPYGITCHFPLWKKDTKAVIREFIGLGFKSVVISTKAELLDESFVGREINEEFLNDLPDNVDPCGENGEFHTFCYDGPIFKNPIKFEIGEKVFKEYKAPKDDENDEGAEQEIKIGFWFCDLIPK